MPLSEQTKELFFSNRGKPIVGLINKKTETIVLAPCITEKVNLNLNDEGEAESGIFITNSFVEGRPINAEQLKQFNLLLKNGHVPRLAKSPSIDDRSSHQFLFEQQCKSTKSSEWGGFTVTLECSGKLIYSFVSGAFNSPPGKRIKGAELSQDLIDKVETQMSECLTELTDLEQQTDTVSLSKDGDASFQTTLCVTPEQKRPCTNNRVHSGSIQLISKANFEDDADHSSGVSTASSDEKEPFEKCFSQKLSNDPENQAHEKIGRRRKRKLARDTFEELRSEAKAESDNDSSDDDAPSLIASKITNS